MLMTVADAARELANRLRGESSESMSALIEHGATIMELEDSLKKALMKGTLRPRSAFTGAFADEQAFLGLRALVSLDDAIEALKPGGYVFPSEGKQWEAPEATPSAPSKTGLKPLPRQRHQENEILRVIRELEYDPKALPVQKSGTKGVKSAVRAKLKFSTSVFDKAWERLRKMEEMADKK